MNEQMTEKWFTKKHKDIIDSCWISDDTKQMYKTILIDAYLDGIKTGIKLKHKKE